MKQQGYRDRTYKEYSLDGSRNRKVETGIS